MQKRTKHVSNLISKLEETQQAFKTLQEEAQERFDSKSENWQDSEKGQETADDISSLEDIVNELENQIDCLNSLFEE